MIDSRRLRLARTSFLAAFAVVATAGLAVSHGDWVAPPDATARKSPIEPTPAHLAAGKAVYEQRCIGCHGPSGRGDGKAAAYLDEKPEDLTEEHVAVQTDGELFWKITTGKKPMPGFSTRLKDVERWQVVAFVRQLGLDAGGSNPAAAAGAGGAASPGSPASPLSPGSPAPTASSPNR